MKNSKKLIALLCMLFMTTAFMIPGISYGESDDMSNSPTVNFGSKTVVRKKPGKCFSVDVENVEKGAKYTATVSDKSVAQLVNGCELPGDYAFFTFYAKKSGKVTVTIKQTLNNVTTTIGTKEYTIKSKPFSAKNKKKEKLYQKAVNKGSDPGRYGVSVEVLKVTKVKNTKDKLTLKLKLQHKVTATEAQLAKKYGYVVILDSDQYGIRFDGKLKKGSRYLTVSSSKKGYPKKATKKGKVYYFRGMSTSKGTPLNLKVKL